MASSARQRSDSSNAQMFHVEHEDSLSLAMFHVEHCGYDPRDWQCSVIHGQRWQLVQK